MPTVLITGANRGLGLELARQYAARNWSVMGTCRQPLRAGPLKAIGPAVEVHQLDVGSAASIRKLSQTLSDRSIDVLINNAGIGGGRFGLGALESGDFLEVMRVNALGPLLMLEAFAEHVTASRRKTVIMVSSRMGSIASGLEEGGDFAYHCSKAALNMVTANAALALKPKGVIVAAVHPGWVKTDMGGPEATLPVAESAHGIIDVVDNLSIDRSGGFFSWAGDPIPW